MAIDPYKMQYYRGDFYPKILTFTDKLTRAPIDLTGMDLTFTVNSERNPTTTGNELFKIDGVIVDAAAGKASFTPTAENTNLPNATYYYDVSAAVGVESKRTMVKGTFVIEMDIGKD